MECVACIGQTKSDVISKLTTKILDVLMWNAFGLKCRIYRFYKPQQNREKYFIFYTEAIKFHIRIYKIGKSKHERVLWTKSLIWEYGSLGPNFWLDTLFNFESKSWKYKYQERYKCSFNKIFICNPTKPNRILQFSWNILHAYTMKQTT